LSSSGGLARKEVIVRDPIHSFVRLDRFPFILKVVSTPQFQRLRHISQLGLSSIVYPAATHNRFAHSLGAMHLMERILDHLHTVGDIEDEAFEDLLRTGTAAALLHDIGHGPLSHVSETAFGFDHEDIGSELISRTSIADILKEDGIDSNRVVNVLNHTVTGKDVLLSQLISSELDVDRLDYLTRDAYFTGVGFGNIDLERIISMLRIFKGSGDLNGHAITLYKGLYSLESYVVSRHLMYKAVYFHKATRGVEKLISNALKRAIERQPTVDIPERFTFLTKSGAPTFADLSLIDDHTLLNTLRNWESCKDPILAELCSMIFQRRLLKVIELTPARFRSYVGGINEKFEELARSNGIDPEYLCPIDGASETPYTAYSFKPPEDDTTVTTNIFVYDEEGIVKEIAHVSDVVAALAETQYFDRLYMPDQIRNKAEALFRSS
jgi:hypothetical protein